MILKDLVVIQNSGDAIKASGLEFQIRIWGLCIQFALSTQAQNCTVYSK